MRSTSNIILQSYDCKGSGRMVSLAEQFRIFIEGQDTNILSDSTALLRFATSAEPPLTMGEISYFLGEIQDFLEGYNIEWCGETDTTLSDKVHFTCYSYLQKNGTSNNR